MNRLKEMHDAGRAWWVWGLRVILGVVFIMSGLAKDIDLWGFVYKIEEYLNHWNVTQPRSIVFIVAMGLSGLEFLIGVFLFTGCYKRTAVWLALLLMAGMLPLSFYIYLTDPVADCGCFGDFWVISNGATFVKNIFITLALIYLARYNGSVGGLFTPYVQWVVAVLCGIYLIVIGLIGYNVQPLVDFRSFPAGSKLVSEDADDSEVEFVFVYEKDGRRQMFAEDELPDSTWTFVDRELKRGDLSETTTFVIIDGDEDITSQVVSGEGEELIMLIPEPERADIAYTYALNELHTYVTDRGGSMVGLLATGDDGLEKWQDLSMASYPLYSAEPTMLKELARGVISLVYLHDGVIVWKRTMASVDVDSFIGAAKNDALADLDTEGPVWFRWFTLVLVTALGLLFLLDRSGQLLKWRRDKVNSK